MLESRHLSWIKKEDPHDLVRKGTTMHMIDATGLSVGHLLLPDRYGGETLLVLVKGTWRIGSGGTLSLAEEQVPVHLEPVYLGEPGASSLIHDTDVVLEKPGTDCILLGHAWAPKGGRAGSVDVSFAVGPVRRTVRVFGERIWMKCLWVSMSDPVPFESMPLLWERSFGGTDTSSADPTHHEFCLENPVGRGLLARKTTLQIDGMRLPNLEDPACLIRYPKDRPRPVGFCPVPAHWQPRAGYAGTYDDSWRKHVCPLPPEDQDPRFYSSAAPGLTTPHYLIGTEAVLVDNATKHGCLAFPLPGVKPQVTVCLGHANEELAMALDTVIVEPDEERLVLVWRGKCTVHGRLHLVGQISVNLLQL